MQITEVHEKLEALQKVLLEKYEIEIQLKENPASLENQKESLSRDKESFLKKDEEYKECKDKILKLEFELDQAEKLREEGEKGMGDISTHREFEALEKQVNEATAKAEDLRKEIDKEKRNLNELDEIINSMKSYIDSLEKQYKEESSKSEKQTKKFEAQIEKLSKKIEEISEGIDPEIIIKFERIVKRRRKGIVSVKNGVCEGCHMILPAQFANEVHDGANILFCPYCSCILKYEESAEAEDYYTMAETGSLAGDDFDDDENINEDEDYSEDNEYDKSSEFDSDDESEDEEESDDDSEEESDEN
ncbi:MAG: nucleic acid-binding protein [Treponema sp.]|nr:nucleic acid-binding protein [Candidatus Treponema scatequi]